MSTKFKKAILLCSILLMAGSTHAFKKCKHGRISKIALDQFEKLYDLKINYFYKRAFIKGSRYEDKLVMVLTKKQNQHFYRPDVQLENNRHFKNRLKKLFGHLNYCLKEDDLYGFWHTLGKIAHYYQDMACPPHVIPIYHLGKDKFDKVCIPKDYLRSIPLNMNTTKLFTGLYPFGLLDTCSALTYNAVQGPLKLKLNNKDTLMNWEVFWTRDTCFNTAEYFGAYGIIGNSYGNTDKNIFCEKINKKNACLRYKRDTHFECTNPGVYYSIDKSEYDNFTMTQVKQALETTCGLIGAGLNILYSKHKDQLIRYNNEQKDAN